MVGGRDSLLHTKIPQFLCVLYFYPSETPLSAPYVWGYDNTSPFPKSDICKDQDTGPGSDSPESSHLCLAKPELGDSGVLLLESVEGWGGYTLPPRTLA